MQIKGEGEEEEEEEVFRPLPLQPLGGCVQHWHIITF